MTARVVNKTNARNRRGMDPSVPKKVTPAVIAEIAATAADTIQVTFDTSVIPNKLPGYVANGQSVASMSRISDTVVELVFDGDVQDSDMTVREGDPGIRTSTGGFVPAGTYAIPTFP